MQLAFPSAHLFFLPVRCWIFPGRKTWESLSTISSRKIMRRTASSFPAPNSWRGRFAFLALAAASLWLCIRADASVRPRLGGTLRVQMSERVENLDPRQRPSAPAQTAALERLDTLVFDRLIRLDGHGTLQPGLD